VLQMVLALELLYSTTHVITDMCNRHAACSATADMSSTWVDGSINLNPKQFIGGMCISCHHNLQYTAISRPTWVATGHKLVCNDDMRLLMRT